MLKPFSDLFYPIINTLVLIACEEFPQENLLFCTDTVSVSIDQDNRTIPGLVVIVFFVANALRCNAPSPESWYLNKFKYYLNLSMFRLGRNLRFGAIKH